MTKTAAAKKRGGPQPGSGRPPKDPNDRVVKCNVSMTKAHHEATGGDRAGMIRRALDFHAKYKKIIDAVTSDAFRKGLYVSSVGGLESREWEIVLMTNNHELVFMLDKWAEDERKRINQPAGAGYVFELT